MPARVDRHLCDGCRGAADPACMRACPGDVITKDYETDRAVVRCPAECWDCYACVKACPKAAIQVELPYALARRLGSLSLESYSTKGALWEVRWPDGRVQRLLRPNEAAALEELEEAGEPIFLATGI
ncbi:MAG: adenylylsulfate reductase [Deltaproteobacteria bacterium]|nr:adenylylsulfate reductase [Deltaproteobacteria bacterium]